MCQKDLWFESQQENFHGFLSSKNLFLQTHGEENC